MTASIREQVSYAISRQRKSDLKKRVIEIIENMLENDAYDALADLAIEQLGEHDALVWCGERDH
jgi:hypothetical protein